MMPFWVLTVLQSCLCCQSRPCTRCVPWHSNASSNYADWAHLETFGLGHEGQLLKHVHLGSRVGAQLLVASRDTFVGCTPAWGSAGMRVCNIHMQSMFCRCMYPLQNKDPSLCTGSCGPASRRAALHDPPPDCCPETAQPKPIPWITWLSLAQLQEAVCWAAEKDS